MLKSTSPNLLVVLFVVVVAVVAIDRLCNLAYDLFEHRHNEGLGFRFPSARRRGMRPSDVAVTTTAAGTAAASGSAAAVAAAAAAAAMAVVTAAPAAAPAAAAAAAAATASAADRLYLLACNPFEHRRNEGLGVSSHLSGRVALGHRMFLWRRHPLAPLPLLLRL